MENRAVRPESRIRPGDRRRTAAGRRHSSTREMLLRMVEAQTAPVSTAALVTASGLHENTVRAHLEQLRDDGYLRRERQQVSGRGRPAWLWQAVRPDAVNPYAGLASALADTLARSGDDAIVHARAAGAEWGAQIAASRIDEAGTANQTVIGVMEEQGFAPTVAGDVVLLRRCPLIEAATRHPEIVCAVHRGMIDGVLRARGDDSESDLVPFTGPGECTLRVRAAR